MSPAAAQHVALVFQSHPRSRAKRRASSAPAIAAAAVTVVLHFMPRAPTETRDGVGGIRRSQSGAVTVVTALEPARRVATTPRRLEKNRAIAFVRQIALYDVANEDFTRERLERSHVASRSSADVYSLEARVVEGRGERARARTEGSC